MKHKHADLIKAWADGAQIQRFSMIYAKWQDAPDPNWDLDFQYRIKPQPDVVKVFYLESNPMLGLRFSEEINSVQGKTERIRCTFDGETYMLKAVEMI